jgi:hypothetical protein
MDDTLPPELSQGPLRLLVYRVSVLNRAGKSEGDSAPAYTAAGPTPVPVTGFAVIPRRKGIILSWQATNQPASTTGWIRFDRTRTSAPPPQPEPTENNSSRNLLTGRNTPGEPAEQILRLPESTAQRQASAIDATAHTGNSYRYIAQRVEQVTIASRSIEIAGLPSAPAETAYADVFPPPVPTGLVSAADTAAKAIDLDWTPDVDPGLAGYIVYRRAAGTSQPPQRISPAGKPVTSSNWTDTTALPGQRYAYSVSAIDVSGNESARSAEIEDQWDTPTSQPNP